MRHHVQGCSHDDDHAYVSSFGKGNHASVRTNHRDSFTRRRTRGEPVQQQQSHLRPPVISSGVHAVDDGSMPIITSTHRTYGREGRRGGERERGEAFTRTPKKTPSAKHDLNWTVLRVMPGSFDSLSLSPSRSFYLLSSAGSFLSAAPPAALHFGPT